MCKRDFILTEAERENDSSMDDEDWEEQEEEEEGEDLGPSRRRKTARGFIGEWMPCSGDRFVAPYVPLALAVSRECPLQFNFDLRLLYHLCLPCELVARTEMPMLPSGEATSQEVSFYTSEEGVTYCQECLHQGWLLDSAERDPCKRP